MLASGGRRADIINAIAAKARDRCLPVTRYSSCIMAYHVMKTCRFVDEQHHYREHHHPEQLQHPVKVWCESFKEVLDTKRASFLKSGTRQGKCAWLNLFWQHSQIINNKTRPPDNILLASISPRCFTRSTHKYARSLRYSSLFTEFLSFHTCHFSAVPGKFNLILNIWGLQLSFRIDDTFSPNLLIHFQFFLHYIIFIAGIGKIYCFIGKWIPPTCSTRTAKSK